MGDADSEYLVALGNSTGFVKSGPWGEEYIEERLQGTDALASFFQTTYLTGDALVDALIACLILLVTVVFILIIAQSFFKNQEID